MNILLLCCEGGIAGSTMSISYLAKGLARSGHGVYLGCRSDTLLYQLLCKSDVRCVPMRLTKRFDMDDMKLIRDLVLENGVSIINAQSSYDRYLSILSRWIFRLPACIVHTRRQMPRSDAGPLQAFFYVKGTDRIVAVSGGVSDALTKKGIPARHITVIHNGTPASKYEGVNSDLTTILRRRYGISEDDRVVGCVSRRKSQEQLLMALELVKQPVTVLFVGIQPDAELEKLRQRLEGKHRIIFCGSVAPEETLSYYPLFSVFVLPSIMEGLSQALLEAMALCVPVIATNAGGNSDLISHGVNGFLYESNATERLAGLILTALDNKELRRSMIENGRRTALEEFSVEKTVQNHERLFTELWQLKKRKWGIRQLPEPSVGSGAL